MNTAYTTPFHSSVGPPTFERASIYNSYLYLHRRFQGECPQCLRRLTERRLPEIFRPGPGEFANSAFSSFPGDVTERGFSNSFGAGVRVGWLGTINQSLSLGATFRRGPTCRISTNTKVCSPNKADLIFRRTWLAAWPSRCSRRRPSCFDVERIFYGQVKSIANPDFPFNAPLGADNGPGFGWHDITSEKVGFDFKLSPTTTLRAGFNHSGLPFDASQNLFNVLAPAVVQNHVTAGPRGGSRVAKRLASLICTPSRTP